MSFFKEFHSEIKILVIIFIIAAVISAGAILILKSFSSSTQEQPEAPQVSIGVETAEESIEIDTSNWQTYRNDEFGFEVKYPSSYTGSSCAPSVYGNTVSIGPIDISFEDADGRTLSDVVDLEKQRVKNAFQSDVISQSETYTNGLRAEKIVVFSCGASCIMTTSTYTKKEDTIFKLSFWDANGVTCLYQYDNVYDAAGEILSTFRFIEPIDTSDWQTYRNEEFGFEWRYPLIYDTAEIYSSCRLLEVRHSRSDLISVGVATISLDIVDTSRTLSDYVDVWTSLELNRVSNSGRILTTIMKSRTSMQMTGREGIEVEFERTLAGDSPSTFTYLFLKKDDQVYRFFYDEDRLRAGSCAVFEDLPGEAFIDQILSTFRFIE